MLCLRSKALMGLAALAGCVIPSAHLQSQSTKVIVITVEDGRAAALRGAEIREPGGRILGRTSQAGTASIPCLVPCKVRVSLPGFDDQELLATGDTSVQLKLESTSEQVSVTAYRTPLSNLESSVTTRVLAQNALASSASITLDEQIRQVPGVQMFRRSSSLVANPSSQGLSLRGLGSTAASRTLVTEDDVPMNDPFAGWIRWQEQPELSIESIELVRGGASDLYGSSAIGGVVNIIPARPTSSFAEFRSSFGAEGTSDNELRLQAKRGSWGVLAAGGSLRTDGYIQVWPSERGPVDIASNVHSRNGLILAEHDRGSLRLLARASGFEDARSNGTPDQTNGSRIWRYATGADWQGPRGGVLTARVYGSTAHFRQVFSQITHLPTAADPNCSYRCGESPTRFSLVPENELGAVAHWSQPIGARLLLVAGADTHDVRVWDREQTFGPSAALTLLRDRQHDTGLYAEVIWSHDRWTATASARIDWFRNADASQQQWNGSAWTPAPTQPTPFSERVFDPRIGVSHSFLEHWAVSASSFRAFRAPTPNELYRSTQVGNLLTVPNFNLLSERATGWEAGLATERRWITVRASYFLTQVNRPITALTIDPASSPILLKRENLGQIESRGVSLDFELAPMRWLTLDGGYQYAHATVTRGPQDLGNWIPAVARNLATLNLRASRPRLGTLSLQSRISGKQFDNDANTYLLHSFFRLDAYASHEIGKRLEIFAAGENLFDRSIEVGKTPATTLDQPRVARVGFLVKLGAPGR
jgi:outer membrane receptor protein involved in Fe transport